MKPIFRNQLASGLLALFALPALAQPSVDIDLHRTDNGGIDVQLTPDADFDGVPASLVFTVAWNAATTDAIPELVQTEMQRSCMALAPSGPVHEVGDIRYRIYCGFGLTPITEIGQPWRGGMAFTIGTFAPGAPSISIADDDWVKDRRNNGAFYVSLNGLERTGHIRSAQHMDSGTDQTTLTVGPNPNNGQPVTFLATQFNDGPLSIDVVDMDGKLIQAQRVTSVNGRAQGVLSLNTALVPGTYQVTARGGSTSVTEKLVVTSRSR
ncbi:MAG: T9SS type A sorting domain-containing protein [Bacteroidetes bacterium]|jgi:hypothetical protein|nr:T9SS type A sorting domain-containing protein [Bacteroidota bacterium]MBX7129939.1 T9SS type A sorting domain-containing protein [Flavobacteriales bacterium]MCC6654707.1 T9SS type A sorting domain-containing protein [Flavobacteriales bacterium]HMU14009.1 T9SS type A sorting domain-containing protein [Flavobacteriales bacterium]HNE81111.1 T9SS type A sorting domain-containing protein [Flavobacteriales bacterium]